MVSEWYQAESMEKPGEWDTKSSPSVVYQRKNIKEITRTEETETITIYSYQERTMSQNEYAAYQAELESPATKMIMQSLSALEMQQETMQELIGE